MATIDGGGSGKHGELYWIILMVIKELSLLCRDVMLMCRMVGR